MVHANAAFTRLTGVDSHEVNGRSVSNLFSMPHQALGQNNGNEVAAQSHQAVASAGRARTQDESVGMNVDRLVVANGFDDYHIINVAAKRSSIEDGSDSIQCRICISPVIAQSMPPAESAVVTDTNHESHHHKRRKHHHNHEGQSSALRYWKNLAMAEPTFHRRSCQNVITHYVIQLEKISPEDLQGLTLTGRSDAADILNKLQQSHQYDRERLEADVEENLDETSHSTDPKEHVATMG